MGRSLLLLMFVNSPPDIPPAPWYLTGAALLLPSSRGALALVHYEDSPVGPYDELAIAVPTWRGPRVVTMLVTSDASRRGGRAIWGYPKELSRLDWTRHDRHVIFSHGRRTWRVRVCGPALPLRLRAWTIQTRDGQRVRVPWAVSGRLRLAWQGRRPALLLEPMHLRVEPPK